MNTKHLLEGSSEDIFKTIQDELDCVEKPEDEDEDPPEEPRQQRPRRRQFEETEKLDVRNYNFGKKNSPSFPPQTFWIF